MKIRTLSVLQEHVSKSTSKDFSKDFCNILQFLLLNVELLLLIRYKSEHQSTITSVVIVIHINNYNQEHTADIFISFEKSRLKDEIR